MGGNQPSRCTGIFRRLWRGELYAPWRLPILVAAALVGDALCVAYRYGCQSDMGESVNHLIGVRHTRGGVTSSTSYHVWRNEAGEFQVELADSSTRPEDGIARVTLYAPEATTSGCWAPTKRRRELWVEGDPGWPPAERSVIGALMLQRPTTALEPLGYSEVAAARMFADSTFVIEEPIPAGYIHTAFAIVASLLFIWSLTLGQPWLSWEAAQARRRRRSIDRARRSPQTPAHIATPRRGDLQ